MKHEHAWQRGVLARAVHAAVALLAAAGLGSSLHLGWHNGTDLPVGASYAGGFAAGWEHMLNQPAYFTFLSAALVCVTSSLLALRPGRGGTLFHAMRLSSVICVMITGLVFNLLLRGPETLTGMWRFNDTVLHTILPVLVPLVWLALGPHGRFSGRRVLLSAVIPVSWLAVTLLRGPGLDWYPYDILDVPGMGYGGVAVYVGAILIGYLALACTLWVLDRLLSRGQAASHAARPCPGCRRRRPLIFPASTRSGRRGTSIPRRSCPGAGRSGPPGPRAQPPAEW